MQRKRSWVPLAALLAVTACNREEVARYRVPKAEAVPSASPGAMGAMGNAPAGAVPPPPDASTTGELRWVLPKGWSESRSGGGMRYATLRPAASGKVEVSVTVFPGPAGGELANVNRWRNQIGLGPVDDAALGRDRKTVRSAAGPVTVFDYTSEGQQKTRLVAGILFAGGNSWFLKLVGDEEPVGSSRADFVRLLESLRLDRS